MNATPSDLFQAFREDHAVLGRGLFDLSNHLRVGDLVAARACAEQVDRAAGAHIAFEERHFYPALRRLLGGLDVDRLYHEHGVGLDAIRRLVGLDEGENLAAGERQRLLRQTELMEAHVAECGDLFGAMGRLPPAEQEALCRALMALREAAPRWTEVGAEEAPPGGGA